MVESYVGSKRKLREMGLHAPALPTSALRPVVSQVATSQRDDVHTSSLKKPLKRVSHATSTTSIDNSFNDIRTPLKRPMLKQLNYGPQTPLSSKRPRLSNTPSNASTDEPAGAGKSLNTSMHKPNFLMQTPTKPFSTPNRHSLNSFMSPSFKSIFTPKMKADLRSIIPDRLHVLPDHSTQPEEADLKPLTGLNLPSYPSEEPSVDIDFQRGLIVSPDKKSGKGKKFIRNGLAERAEQLIKRSQTSYLLWQKEVETHIASSRKVTPNLRLRVINIAHTMCASNMSRERGSLRNLLAQCEILTPNIDDTESRDKCIVSFTFPTQSNRHVLPQDFPEGTEVYVWKPYFEVIMDATAISNLILEEGGESNLSKSKVLLCSRFFVKPKA